MELSKNSPITIGTIAMPGSTIVCEFTTIGTKRPIKFNINTHIYRRHTVHKDMIDVITSDEHCIYTSPIEDTHIVKMKIPQYERRDLFRSFVQMTMDQNEDHYIRVFVTNISTEENLRYDERKRKEKDERKIREEQERLEDIVIASLPKDPVNRIFYIRPYNNDSFSIISQHHIQYMRKNIKCEKHNEENNEDNRFEIVDMGWDRIGDMNLNIKRNILLHPFLYPLIHTDYFKNNLTVFHKLLKVKNKIGGLEVADFDRISLLAVSMINKLDLMIVPSNFAKNSFINSGVNIPVEILPYGIPDEFLNNDNNTESHTENPEIINLRKIKDKGNILILYFFAHSGYRKGADLVKDVIDRINTKFNNVYLVVKGPIIITFSNIRVIQINSWLNNNDLKCLYDVCDICISPSRGGGFELNALEAISRGVPTITTNGGCFLDYIDYVIPININEKTTQPILENKVHVGFGCEADINDFETKLTDTINNLEEYKRKFKGSLKEIREKYSWKSITNILEEYLIKYEFIN